MRAITIPARATGSVIDQSPAIRWRVKIGIAAAMLLLSALSILSRPAMADSSSYSTAQRQLKVGILLLESTDNKDGRGPENPDPHVFYIADAYNELKPQNWEFINPLAPNAVTASIRNRWIARDARNPYQIGQKVVKRMAAYWEVPLTSTPIEDLLQFDLLLVHSHRKTAFTPADREKLRKLVDAGGIIWMEDCGGMYIPGTAPFFLSQVQFKGNAIGPPKPEVNVADHPLLNTPYQLSYEEISTLGDKNYGNFALFTANPAAPDDPTQAIAQAPNPETLINIIGNGNNATRDINGKGLPYVAAGNYGGGSVVLTSGDSCCDINDYAGPVTPGVGGNAGAFCGPNIKTAHPEDLKFLYNVAAWGSSNSAYRRNNRRLAASFEGVGAPLVTAFSIRNPFTETYQPQDLVDARSAPLIIKNTMFVAGKIAGTDQLTVRAYDINPYRDLDGDGNPDDGKQDLSLGLPYDEIWRWDGGTTSVGQYPSAPVYGSVLINGAGDRQDVVFVTLPDGTVISLTAFPKNGRVLAATPTTSTFAGTGGNYTSMPRGVAPSPTFFENRVYTVEPNGLVVCFSARNGVELWRSFNGSAPYTISPCGTPTLGFSRQDTNTSFSRASIGSTNDLMLYVPCITNDTSGQTSARYLAYWLGTRNEVVSFKDNRDPSNNSNGILNTRIAGGPGGPMIGQYFMANGVSDGVGGNTAGAFLVPTLRVFSGNRNAPTNPPNPNPPPTAIQNYANGIISSDYSATIDVTTGQITVKRENNSAPAVSDNPDVMVAVDYDVAYVVGNKIPTAYTSNPTQVGARNNEALRIPYTEPGTPNGSLTGNYGLSTATFSPEDYLIFGANQFNKDGYNVNVPSVFAVNEQEGLETSRVRWRYTLFNEVASGSLTAAQQVDNTTVEDRVPLINYLTFSSLTAATRSNTPEALKSPVIVGSPLTTNDGYTYVMAEAQSTLNGGFVSVLMAFKTNPQIVLTLPESFETTRGVTLSQVDWLGSSAGRAQSIVVRSGAPQLLLDGDRGRITVVNARAANNQAFSASQSFVVEYWPKGGSSPKRTIIPPVPQGSTLTYGTGNDEQGNQVTATPASAPFSPLLWYYVLPGRPLSSPTLVGDYVYYTMTNTVGPTAGQTHVVAVDASPAASDGKIRIGYAEPVLNVVSTLNGQDNKTNHVRMIQPLDPLGTNQPAVAEAPPVGSSGLLALNSSKGTFTLTDNVTVVADNRRITEVSADSAAKWVLDSTVNFILAGGALPVYGPNGNILNANTTGRLVSSRQSVSRPTSLQKMNSDYLFADSGNNRVVRTDRAGHIVWQMSSFADPYGLLKGGETTGLKEPTDVQFYTVYSYDANSVITGYEIHYIIADAGNFRIVEVADYYDRDGTPKAAPVANAGISDHALVWTTRTQSTSNKSYRFLSLQRYLGLSPDGTKYGYPYILAVVGNSNVATAASQAVNESAGGALVQLNYNPINTPIYLTDLTGNPQAPTLFWQIGQAEPGGNGMARNTTEEILIGRGTNGTTPPLPKKMVAPTYFRQVNLRPSNLNPAPSTLNLICEADGVYITKTIYPTGGTPYTYVLWMFTQDDYDKMNVIRGLTLANGGKLPKFKPTSVQLLANGNILITNGAAERNVAFKSGQFVGEAFEVTPVGGSLLIAAATNDDTTPTKLPLPLGQAEKNLNPLAPSGLFANFAAPRLETGSAGIANRQVMGIAESNTGLLEQPQVAIRP